MWFKENRSISVGASAVKFLVTGGCGFLGSNVAAEILRRNEELLVFDNLSRYGSNQNLAWLRRQGDFKFLSADIRNTSEVEYAVTSVYPDIIFHLAGQVAMTTSIEDPRMDFETNAFGTFNLLEAVRKYSPESIIIYSSTNKVYGDLEWLRYEENELRYLAPDFPAGFPETIPLEFHSPYGCSKGAADQYLLDYARIYGLKTVVFRHSSMYGGRQFPTYDQGWIGWFCRKALELKKGILKETITISGTGKQVRDVLHADDVIKLYFRIIENIDKARGHAFNIGGGMENSLSLLELFNILENKLGIKIPYAKLPWRVSDQKIFVADINKIRNFTGWIPNVDKDTGIKKMLEWVDDNLKTLTNGSFESFQRTPESRIY